ncbi:spermidine/putrescine ABC transporter substrate-binding protein [Eubacteriales bacterium OttesenSCG-928-N14]|nr:spermidine/putrescine ABC transporter substrate-binding protein [Eubacteriales bacterium OttesenSCG-928-N14]
MKKRVFVIVLCMMLLALPLVGCGGGEGGSSRQLRVFIWGDFIDEELVKDFEAETGITINFTYFDSNEMMMAKIAGGDKYDLCFPSDYAVEKMKMLDQLAEIDHSKIENLANIDESFLGHAFDAENKYSIPYMWGTVGILYNKDLVDGPIDSWEALFDKKYAGKVIMYDSVRDSFVPAMRYLGYDINSTNPDEIKAAEDLLYQQNKEDGIVRSYLIDEAKGAMVTGNYALNLTYSGDAVIAMEEADFLDYVVPKEGSNIWFDNVSILKTCEDMDAAHEFINFLCDAEVAAANAEYVGYSTPNKAAVELLPQELLDNPVFNPSQDVIDRCKVFVDLGDAMKIYNDAWLRIRS